MRKFFAHCALALLALVAIPATGNAGAPFCGHPTPEILPITDPAQPLVGRWVGQWDSGTCHELHVFAIKGDTAEIVYYIDGPKANVYRNEQFKNIRVTTNTEGNLVLSMQFASGAQPLVSYTLRGSRIRGMWLSAHGSSFVDLMQSE